MIGNKENIKRAKEVNWTYIQMLINENVSLT